MPILFSSKSAEFGWLSNFSPDAFTLNALRWASVEHCYQAQKFVGTEASERIRRADTPLKARKAGQDRSLVPRADWDEVKEDVMRRALEAKFAQNRRARERLHCPMKLPGAYMQILAEGESALTAIAARTRTHAERNPASPELWLSVRDFAGLAGRLTELDAFAWEQGFARGSFNGQDICVLDELLLSDGTKTAAHRYEVSDAEATALRRLRTFLSDYLMIEPAETAPAPPPDRDAIREALDAREREANASRDLF